MTKNNIIKGTFTLVLLLILLSALALATPNSLNIQGKLTDSNEKLKTGTFNFTFRIYDDFTSGNKLYETNITATADSRGVYDAILQNINLPFDKQYYLAVKVNDDAEMEPRVNLTSVPYSFTSNQSKALNTTRDVSINENINLTIAGNIDAAGNLTVGQKITFGLGEFIDNLVDGFLKITGNLNVTENLIALGNITLGDTGIDTITITSDKFNVSGGDLGLSGGIEAGSLNISGDININNNINLTALGNVDVAGTVNADTLKAVTQLDVGGGFSAGGLTIQSDGNIVTQGDVLFSGNITILNVTHLSVNGSLLPGLDTAFDVGNASFRWQNANFSGTLQAGTLSDGTASITGGIITSASISADQVSAAALDIGANSFTINSIEIVGSDGVVNDAAIESTLTRDTELDNDTLVRTTRLRTALSNNTDATLINLTVISLPLGWTNLTNYPNACPSGQFVTTVNDTLTCATPSPLSGGGFTDDGTNVRLTTETDLVGIGTLTPLSKLHVNDSSAAGAFRVTNESGTTIFFVNGSSRKVGIGTTTPNDILEVIGSVRISGSLNASSLNVSDFILIGGNNVVTNFNLGNITNDTVSPAQVDNITIIRIVNLTTLDTLDNYVQIGDFNLGNITNDTVSPAQVDNITILRVTNISNILLDAFKLENITGGENISISADGVISINVSLSGTDTQASTQDHVNNITDFLGEPNASLIRVDNLTTLDTLDNYVQIGDFNLGNITNDTLRSNDNITIALWNVSGTDIFLRELTGNVGIGTTTPGEKLHVIGNINATGNITAGSGTIILDSTNDRIGIGTTAPLQTLVVVGTVNITDSLNVSGTVEAVRFIGNGTVPSGMIAFFASTSCPNGWDEYTSARGRVIIGLVSGGTSEGTVGTAFTNQEDRTHTHTGPSHTHTTGDHTLTTSEMPSHTHTYTINDASGSTQGYQASGLKGSSTKTSGSAGSGNAHNHGNTGADGTGATGTAATSNVIPYIQLLACQAS